MQYAACIANSIFVMIRSVLCSVLCFSAVHSVSAEEMASSPFDLAAWKRTYLTQVENPQQWDNDFNRTASGWNGGNEAAVAETFIITWGPLGIRTRMHDGVYVAGEAFRAIWPKCLLDSEGELIRNAFEVVEVMPGSPADGHLQQGDLLLAMSGKEFLTSNMLRHGLPKWQHQESRSLELHAAQLLDAAEGVGEVNFRVLRNPQPAAAVPAGWQVKFDKKLFGVSEPVPFEVAQQGGEEVWFEISDGGNGIGSDGCTWKDVSLTDAGGKAVPISALIITGHSVGYGSATVTNEGRDLFAHANSRIRAVVPAGANWTLRGQAAVSSGYTTVEASIKTRKPVNLSPSLAVQTKEITFPIPRIGSFDQAHPETCAKAANIIAMQAAWLARQQLEDGSWPRMHGYTRPYYDTAWALLGLLSVDDPQYQPNIRKAASYLANMKEIDDWSIPRSMALIALCEYWLRTRDDAVLEGMRWHVKNVLECLNPDMSAGHKVSTPGYGGGGVSCGGSHVCLALAMAHLTPAKPPAGIVDAMLSRAQELAPDGYIPYGRLRGWAEFDESAVESGPTYSGRHGPYLVASLIHGGPEIFTKNCSELYSKGPVGGMDQGHATQTLSMQWGFIASAMLGEKTYRRQIEALQWRVTMQRAYRGGFGQNAYRLEYQGGESLLNYALRTGSWLVILNGPRRNLAITGRDHQYAPPLAKLPPLNDHDASWHGRYLRDWSVAEVLLGKNCPAVLRDALKKLADMPKGEGFHQRFQDFLLAEAPRCAQAVLASAHADANEKAQIAEMVLGIDHSIQLSDKGITLASRHPLAGRCVMAEEAKAWSAALPLPMSGTMTIVDPDRLLPAAAEITIDPVKGVEFAKDHLATQVIEMALPAGDFTLTARFRYRVKDLLIEYQRPVVFGVAEEWRSGESQRSVINDRRFWVPGRLIHDHKGWDLSFQLPNGRRIAAAASGHAVKVLSADGKESISPEAYSLQAGTACHFCYTPGIFIQEARVPFVKVLAR